MRWIFDPTESVDGYKDEFWYLLIVKSFQKILSEAVSQKLKNELKGMGPLRAKEIGITTNDFVSLVYDGDIAQYVAKHTPFLLNLTVDGRDEGEKKYVLKYMI